MTELEKQKMHYEHQLKEVELQALTAAEREELRKKFQEGLDEVNAKIAKGG